MHISTITLKIRAYIQWPVLLGTSDNPGMSKQIMLCNQLSWMLIHTNLIYLVIDYLTFGVFLRTLTTTALIGVSASCLLLNKYSFTFVSRLISSFLYSSYIFIYGIIIKFYMSPPHLIHYISPRIPLLMFVFFPLMLLDYRKEAMAFWSTFILNIAFVVLYDPIHQWLGIDMQNFGLQLNNYGVLTLNSITFMVNICTGIIFFQSVSNRYEESINQLNREISNQNEELAQQNEELMQKQEAINNLVEHLEEMVNERTLKLSLRNEQLSRYAFANAHELRGPVASILGLMEVIKNTSEEEERKALMRMMEESVLNLDKVVHNLQELLRDDEQPMPPPNLFENF